MAVVTFSPVSGPCLAAIVSTMNEVVAPHVVTILWSEPNARAVIQPQESRQASAEKMMAVVAEFCAMRLAKAADLL